VRSESSEDLQCSEAFCVDSCVEGSERASRPISHCRLENALPAAESLNKDGNVDNGEEGRSLEGGTEGGAREVSEEDSLADIDGGKYMYGASNRDADGVSRAEDIDTSFSFLTSSEGQATDTMGRSSDDEDVREGGLARCTANLCDIDPTLSVVEVEDLRSPEEAGEEVVLERSAKNNTVPGTEKDAEYSGGYRTDPTALPEMAPLPSPPLPSPLLPLPRPQKAKKQTRFLLDDTKHTVQALSISAPLSMSSCMASPAGSLSPGGDRGDGWTETDHVLFAKVDNGTIFNLFALAQFLIVHLYLRTSRIVFALLSQE
jgi:hypothetical protein